MKPTFILLNFLPSATVAGIMLYFQNQVISGWYSKAFYIALGVQLSLQGLMIIFSLIAMAAGLLAYKITKAILSQPDWRQQIKTSPDTMAKVKELDIKYSPIGIAVKVWYALILGNAYLLTYNGYIKLGGTVLGLFLAHMLLSKMTRNIAEGSNQQWSWIRRELDPS